MLQWWRAVGNTVSDLTGQRYEPQTSRSRDDRAAARPTEIRNPYSLLHPSRILGGNLNRLPPENPVRVKQALGVEELRIFRLLQFQLFCSLFFIEHA